MDRCRTPCSYPPCTGAPRHRGLQGATPCPALPPALPALPPTPRPSVELDPADQAAPGTQLPAWARAGGYVHGGYCMGGAAQGVAGPDWHTSHACTHTSHAHHAHAYTRTCAMTVRHMAYQRICATSIRRMAHERTCAEYIRRMRYTRTCAQCLRHMSHARTWHTCLRQMACLRTWHASVRRMRGVPRAHPTPQPRDSESLRRIGPCLRTHRTPQTAHPAYRQTDPQGLLLPSQRIRGVGLRTRRNPPRTRTRRHPPHTSLPEPRTRRTRRTHPSYLRCAACAFPATTNAR
jgi:hypothetical protein